MWSVRDTRSQKTMETSRAGAGDWHHLRRLPADLRPMIRATRDYKMFQIPLSYPMLLFQAERSVQFIPDGDVGPGINNVLWIATIAAGIIVFVANWRFEGLRKNLAATARCGDLLRGDTDGGNPWVWGVS